MNPSTSDSRNRLTYAEDRAIMPVGDQPAILDNEISAQPAVQVPRTVTAANGCRVKIKIRKRTPQCGILLRGVRAIPRDHVHRESGTQFLKSHSVQISDQKFSEHPTEIVPNIRLNLCQTSE